MGVPVKFDDSGSNHSRDIRAAHFVLDDERRTTPAYAGHRVRAKRHNSVLHKDRCMEPVELATSKFRAM